LSRPKHDRGRTAIKNKLSFPQTNASVLLDLVRGVAALVVVLGHGRNFLFADYKELSYHPLWVSIPYLLTKGGHQSVIVFFVLSGYLISGSVFRMVKQGTWSWTTYLTQRAVRLWVVLLPALLLSTLWDRLGLALHLAPALYRSSAPNHMGTAVASQLSPPIFLQNLFFLQGLTAPTFGSDAPLWSLANEFWYYLLFPLGLFALARRTPPRIRIPSAILFLLAAWFSHAVLAMFPLWLAGTLLAVLPTRSFPRAARVLATLVYLPIFCFCASGILSVVAMDYVLALATLMFLWVLLSADSPASPTRAVRASRELARFSYTLYAVHFPFLLLLTALLVGETRWTPTPLNLLKACAICALVLAYAYAVASLTEFHTAQVRRWVEEKLGLVGEPAGPRASPSPASTAAAPEIGLPLGSHAGLTARAAEVEERHPARH
jgi:peptidoglycan/LPS O-acetylase OafA/YrhL